MRSAESSVDGEKQPPSADAVGVGTPSPGPGREPQRLGHLPPSPVSVAGCVLPRGTIDNLPLFVTTPRTFRQTLSSLWTKAGLPGDEC